LRPQRPKSAMNSKNVTVSCLFSGTLASQPSPQGKTKRQTSPQGQRRPRLSSSDAIVKQRKPFLGSREGPPRKERTTRTENSVAAGPAGAPERPNLRLPLGQTATLVIRSLIARSRAPAQRGGAVGGGHVGSRGPSVKLFLKELSHSHDVIAVINFVVDLPWLADNRP
jgi:hypothetical protein